MRKFRMPAHGTVVAYTALFVTLGGTAVALESGAITQREIATGGVGSSEIKTGAVKRSEIRTGGVGTAEIRTGGVRRAEIAEGAVRADELAEDSVSSDEIVNGAVGTDDVADGAITAAKIATTGITGDQIADGSLKLADLAQGVETVTYDPPVMSPGDCSAKDEIAVPNKRAGDTVLVMPGPAGGTDGWNDEFTLDGYGTSADGAGNTISVVVCRSFGSGPVDAGPQPLRVLLFR